MVFADVDPDSGLMTPETLTEALTRLDGRKLRAVLPVHLRGDAADLPGLAALAADAGAVLVEDAPHALGTTMTFGNVAERVGDVRHSAMATFSFHPVKTIATGEGGMVTTNDARLAERLRTLRSHGMTRPPGADPWWYEMAEPGFNYRLPDILCALGLSQLRKLPVSPRAARAHGAYEAALTPASRPGPPGRAPGLGEPVLHLMRAHRLRGRRRSRRVGRGAEGQGRRDQVHYIPVHRQPYYRGLYGDLALPGAEAWYARTLSLPLFPGMADGDVGRVVGALKGVLGL